MKIITLMGLASLLFLVAVMLLPTKSGKTTKGNEENNCRGCEQGLRLENHVHVSEGGTPRMICGKSPVMRRT